ncbi:hypothetical protein HU749_022350 [Pseudomonas ogarae]|uniref:hypothetical protein n=1 Tax=Pseudomonas ogarae (strain DSM 112162 / CECT 30235 / F113) TaxID=1114970 RepID=UPI00164602F9|nr:hypothetical protein [Pseudomonas zarinae]QXH93558.1 hypothetical protein HU749_022350 [Pseudomonas zarinae]
MPLNSSADTPMGGHSKAELLERLEQGNITLGWGAIVAFDRAHINQILQKQYLAHMNDLSFLVPFNRRFFTDADEIEEIQLERLVLGEPRLSFESATLGDSQVTLTMNIISGSYTSTSHVPARPPLVRESFNFLEDMGYQVRMTVDLAVVHGTVDERGRVLLDLSRGLDVMCNLGSSEYSQRRIGDAVKVYLEEHPTYRKIFVLGIVDYNDYSPLAPRAFYLRTQAAPGGADIRSVNYGEGALVMFIQLTSNPEEGDLPLNDRGFPYLIPNDLENGQPKYSGSVVVEKRLIPFVGEGELDLLKHLLFPNSYVFTDSEPPYTPHDLVVFGNISMTADARVVEPARVAVKGGVPTRFNVFSGTGGAPTPARWSVSSLDSPLAVGDMVGNTYTPLAPISMGFNQQVSVVTAHYSDSQGERSYSGLVVESYQSIVVSPRICTWGEGMGPVHLKASSLGNNPLAWILVGDEKGELTVLDSYNAVFTPRAELGQPVWIQTIEVKDTRTGEFTRAAVIIIVAPQSLRILPYHVPAVTASSLIQLNVANLADPSRAGWEVYGEGTISPSGVFTPPSSSETPVSVVLGETSDDAWGYAIVQLVERQREAPRWKNLTGFAIEALDTTQCYINGLQQIPLRIKIETESVTFDGVSIDIPLNDVELSTLKLVVLDSHAEVPFIEAHREGIEENERDWAVNVQRNRFRLHSPGAVKETDPARPLESRNGRTRYRYLYVQSTFEGTLEFYAAFQADDNQVWRSTKQEWVNNTIQLRGAPLPRPVTDEGPNSHYDFTRVRAHTGQGHETPDDPFSYLLDSIDYWKFDYRRQGIYPVGMATLKVLGNASTLQYESEQLDETFASYTGYGFYPQPFGREDSPPTGLVFDAYFRALCNTLNYEGPSSAFVEQHRPSPGQLIVSLHRVADMPYWHDSMATDPLMRYRERLNSPVRFLLRDEEGNRHRFDVSFDIPSREDSRNRLLLNFQ